MKRINTLQNLLLIAIADGKVTQEEIDTVYGYSRQMGISDEEVNVLVKKIKELDFIIPETKEEKMDELYKLVLIALADNELADEEYSELLFFAESCGFTENELKAYIDASYERRNKQEESLIRGNLVQYDLVLTGIRASGKSDLEIVAVLHKCTQSKDLEILFSNDPKENHAFYSFLWLMYCRYAKLNKSGIVMLMMQLELAKTGGYSLEDIIYDFKLTEEGYYDGSAIQIDRTGLEFLKKDLKASFPFNK